MLQFCHIIVTKLIGLPVFPRACESAFPLSPLAASVGIEPVEGKLQEISFMFDLFPQFEKKSYDIVYCINVPLFHPFPHFRKKSYDILYVPHLSSISVSEFISIVQPFLHLQFC